MITVPHQFVSVSESEYLRRNHIVSRLSLGLMGIMIFSIVSTVLLRPFALDRSLLNQFVIALFYAGLAWLTQYRKSTIAPLLLVLSVLAVAVTSTLNAITTGLGPVVLLVCVMVGSMVLRPRYNVLIGALCVSSVIAMGILAHMNVLNPPTQMGLAAVTILYTTIIAFGAFLAFLSARSQADALQRMAEQADAVAAQNAELAEKSMLLMQQAAALAQQREMLEIEVQKRTAELQSALNEVKRSAVVLRELQSPLVPIMEGVVILPLIGAFDSQRAVAFQGELLRGIEARRAHTVLLDVTGLPVMDTLAAQTLLHASNAAKLLGATVVLVGMTPSVAQTIVGLGFDLNVLRIERDLQSAVAVALGQQKAIKR